MNEQIITMFVDEKKKKNKKQKMENFRAIKIEKFHMKENLHLNGRGRVKVNRVILIVKCSMGNKKVEVGILNDSFLFTLTSWSWRMNSKF